MNGLTAYLCLVGAVGSAIYAFLVFGGWLKPLSQRTMAFLVLVLLSYAFATKLRLETAEMRISIIERK